MEGAPGLPCMRFPGGAPAGGPWREPRVGFQAGSHGRSSLEGSPVVVNKRGSRGVCLAERSAGSII